MRTKIYLCVNVFLEIYLCAQTNKELYATFIIVNLSRNLTETSELQPIRREHFRF